MNLPEPEAAIELADAILFDLEEEKKIDPLLIFAGLGCAFIEQHIRIGGMKKEWLKLTQEMAEIYEWSQNE